MGRNFGQRPSEMIGIDNPITAMDFDLALSLRLMRFDNDKDDQQRRFWIQMFGGESSDKPT